MNVVCVCVCVCGAGGGGGTYQTELTDNVPRTSDFEPYQVMFLLLPRQVRSYTDGYIIQISCHVRKKKGIALSNQEKRNNTTVCYITSLAHDQVYT